MKKASIIIMVLSAISIVTFTILFWHPVTDNAVDSNGFWCYMYGDKSNLWPVFSSGVIFLMGLTCYLATLEQKSARY
jgi:hypothetical protein